MRTVPSRLSPLALALATAFALPAQQGERKVDLDHVPAPVKTAILAQVGKGKLVDIGTWQRDGATVYEIEMLVDGREYDVEFAADGTVRERRDEGPAAQKAGAGDAGSDAFQDAFGLEDRTFASTGRNRYFVLEPGYQLVLEGTADGHTSNLTITVLDETKRIGGIETRVVEERESVDGALVEVSRNFFAICTRTQSAFYFGEEVDLYEQGKVVGHKGAWLHGEGGARAGMAMPGEPLLGARWYEEIAPGIAMDRARVAATDVALTTPAGTFRDCLRLHEENPLDGDAEDKVHAPGIGLVQDEHLVLVRHGFVESRR